MQFKYLKLIFESFLVVLLSPLIIPGKFYFINSLPIWLLRKFNFVVSEDTHGVVRFSDKQNQNIEESPKFSWRASWKNLKNISSDVKAIPEKNPNMGG